MTFVLVTAKREGSEISAVIAHHEIDKLWLLAHSLRDRGMTWTAKAHAGQSHSHSEIPERTA